MDDYTNPTVSIKPNISTGVFIISEAKTLNNKIQLYFDLIFRMSQKERERERGGCCVICYELKLTFKNQLLVICDY